MALEPDKTTESSFHIDPKTFFDRVSLYLSKKKGNMPYGFNWHQSADMKIAQALDRNEPWAGYGISGLDTAATEAGHVDTDITASDYAYYTEVFGYDEFALGAEGRTILDVGAGRTLFGPITNMVYGNHGTKVICMDPAYSNQAVVEEIKTEAQAIYDFTNSPGITEPQQTEFIEGMGQRIPLPDKSVDDAISNFAATLVPPEQFPDVVMEMCRVARDQVQITPFTAFKNLKEVELPKGVRFRQNSLDIFTMVIDPGEVNYADLSKWLVGREYAEAGQFESSPDLAQKRKEGYYYKEYINKDYEVFDLDAFLAEKGLNQSDFELDHSDVDESGMLVKGKKSAQN